ncbi:hypothetical protein CRV24_009553 [Beauveria bassiana]|nr:hypothetical protein CRV24_009553 [Beauveria bassiana]
MNSHRDLSLAAPHVVERFARDFLTDKCGVIRQNTRSGRDRILYYRKISGPDLASQVRLMRHVSHDNIVHVLRAMECEDSEHLLEISEYMSHVVVDLCVKSFAAFDELALAAILGQVLRGLKSMTDAGLGQTNFSTSKILADNHGNVKIACAAYSKNWQNRPTMLVPLVHQLMYVSLGLRQGNLISFRQVVRGFGSNRVLASTVAAQCNHGGLDDSKARFHD